MCDKDNLQSFINKADLILSESHATLASEGSNALAGHAALPRKLAAIYAEEAAKPNRIKQSVSQTGCLVSKLVEREQLSCLVVNLHRGNEGYSIALKLPGGLETETIRLAYEDDDFLNYIDQEQLPPMLLDLLDEAGVSEMFQSGCLVAEIRDYRRYNNDPVTLTAAPAPHNDTRHSDTRHVLLRPNMQSVVADVAWLTRDKDWSNYDRTRLEAEVVRATAPPLCLEPSLSAALLTRRLHSHANAINTRSLRQAAKRSSQPSQNRQKKFEEGPAPKCLRLLNFLNEKKDKRPVARAIPKPVFPLATEQTMEPNPSELFGGAIPNLSTFMKHVSEELLKHAKPVERPLDTCDNSLHFVEQHTLETERAQGRIYLTKLTIHQRRTDQVFCGELYVDRDYQEGKNNGSTCTFTHPSLQSVHRYIAQFREIFSEEGRKRVKITTELAGQPTRVSYTAGSRERATMTEHFRQAAVAHKQQGDRQSGTGQKVTVSCAGGGGNALGVVVCRPQTTPQHGLHHTTRLHHSATQLPGVAVSQPQQQQVLLGRNVHLGSLLSSGRVAVTTSAVGQLQQQLSTQSSVACPHKIPITVSAGGAGVGLSGATKSHRDSSEGPSKLSSIMTSSMGAVPALQALLAGTPSAENPAPNSRGTALIERLSQQLAHPNKGVETNATVKVDITASALPTITTITLTPTTGSLSCSSSRGHVLSSIASSSISSSAGNTISSSSHISSSSSNSSTPVTGGMRSDSGSAPPNINIANITNLPGLNVGLQNLASGLSGLQNVQVSIPGLAVPISLSLNPGSGGGTNALGQTHQVQVQQQQPQQQQGGGGASSQSSHPVIIASPQQHTVGSGGGQSVTSAGAQTVVLATATSLPQGHLLHLPLVQGSQLAAQLSKPSGQQQQQATSINVLQSMNSGSGGGTNLLPVSSGGGGTELVSTAGLLPRSNQSVMQRTSKQQLQLALQKPGQHMQQKLMQIAAKKTQLQQIQQQQQQQQQQLHLQLQQQQQHQSQQPPQ